MKNKYNLRLTDVTAEELNSSEFIPAENCLVESTEANKLRIGDGRTMLKDLKNIGEINEPHYLKLSYTAVGNTDTDVKLRTGIKDLDDPIIMVQPTNDNAALFTIASGLRYDSKTGDIDFNVSALQDKEVYAYTVLIK